MSLNPKQRRFVAEYIKDQNGTQAAIRAGYSPKTAQEQSSQLLSKLIVKAAIDERLRKIEAQSDITVDRIRAALVAMAEADILDAFNPDGTLKPLSEIPKPVRMLLAGVEFNEGAGELTKLKFADRARLYEMLGKHLRMFTEMHEVTGHKGSPLQVRNLDFSNIDEKTLLKIAGMDAAA